MELPLGLVLCKQNQVCRLIKSLYSLRQASHQWFAKLSSALLSIGFNHSHHDHSLFIKQQSTNITILLIYVDDVILTSNSMDEIYSVKQFLHKFFQIKDLGDLKYFLGLEVSRSKLGIYLCQRKYALDILFNTSMLASKLASTSMIKDSKLLYDSKATPYDPTTYRCLIGKLLYLPITRPNIAFVVQQLSQFIQHPTFHHFEVAMNILRYIKKAPTQGLFFASDSPLQLKAFSDSNWASCCLTCKSVTSFFIFLGASLISWRFKKQNTMSRSSPEAEYLVLTSTTCEI